MRLSSVQMTRTRDVVAVEVLQLGQLEGGVKTRLRAVERVTDESYNFQTGRGRFLVG